MTDPERIWVCLDDSQDKCCPVEDSDDPAEWGTFFDPQTATAYVRADLFDALKAENERLRGMLSARLEDRTITPDQIINNDDWHDRLSGDAPLVDLARLKSAEAENERLRAERDTMLGLLMEARAYVAERDELRAKVQQLRAMIDGSTATDATTKTADNDAPP